MATTNTIRTWQELRRASSPEHWTILAEVNPCTPDEMDPKPIIEEPRLTEAQQMNNFYGAWADRQAESKGLTS